MSTGFSTRLTYDTCAYDERLNRSVQPYSYSMNPNYYFNSNGCMPNMGIVNGHNGMGSSYVGNVVAAGQKNVVIDNIMKNLNVPGSKCNKYGVNPVNVLNLNVPEVNMCNNSNLFNINSKIETPTMFYRSIPIDRFLNLRQDPQKFIFYDFAQNTHLEAIDNYDPEYPISLNDPDPVIDPQFKRNFPNFSG